MTAVPRTTRLRGIGKTFPVTHSVVLDGSSLALIADPAISAADNGPVAWRRVVRTSRESSLRVKYRVRL